MATLEQLTTGTRVCGIGGMSAAVEVVAVKWHGNSAVTLTYKDNSGRVAEQLLFRSDEESLSISEAGLPWSFDADANLLRLASEAYRISLAHVFDPYLAVHTSTVDPLPHQITAVYEEMLPRLPLRYVLADDPGAGKTIMAGLLIKELMARGSLQRCLVVPPGSLAEQWQDELLSKFGLGFKIITNQDLEASAGGNVFQEENLCILRLDKLSRNEDVQAKLKKSNWDLVICDEAHKMSATVWGNEVRYTKRYQAGRLLASITEHFLLLTATPHNGKDADFQLFMALIDPDRFEGVGRNRNQKVDVSDVMRRLVKEDLLKFDGTRLFPERRAYTVNYDLSPAEKALYDEVTSYVRKEYNRADQLDKPRRNSVGFALTILQRRLASSPEAIYQSLRRRRERLERRVEEEIQGHWEDKMASLNYALLDDAYDPDDYSAAELETDEEEVVDRATAARTVAELQAEISTLRELEAKANQVRHSGGDRKWRELARILQDDKAMFGKEGEREKLIIFTEHRDTLRYLKRQIGSLLGSEDAVVTIHGGLNREERHRVEESFRQDPNVRILLATDAAGEGINLQRAHLMVNYDLPWNPNRLEQRFGRIHRIGQNEVCHLWNLVAKETREGAVYHRLLQKLEAESEALNGRVFEVLGKVSFDNKSLRDLMVEAIRYNSSKEVENRLFEVVDASLDTRKLVALLEEHALAQNTMDVEKVLAVREDMERREALRLQPNFIRSFFEDAFRSIGGRMARREEGRYEITRVPFDMRNPTWEKRNAHVLGRYERICFDKRHCVVPGKPTADLIAPGHPLLDALVRLILERNTDTLRRGAILVDDGDEGTAPRLLFYVEDSLQDGTLLASGARRVVSKGLHFVEMREDGTACDGGAAPYLDYRTPSGEEKDALLDFLRGQTWLGGDVEAKAMEYAISTVIPAHVAEVRTRTNKRVSRTLQAVTERLTREINHWSFRAIELRQAEAAGKGHGEANSARAALRAEELTTRLKDRTEQLERERQVSALPPVIVGGAAVIPKGLVDKLMGRPGLTSADIEARKTVEKTAMDAVMEIERSLGYEPRDVSAENRGYDIESRIPQQAGEEGHRLRFIEVKGRAKGATNISVTKNEILVALNTPEQYILATVEVDGDSTRTAYFQEPFHTPPDYGAIGVSYSISDLRTGAKCVLERQKP